MPRIDSSLPQVHRPAIPSFREATKRSPDNTANGLLPIAHALGAFVVTFVCVGAISLGVHWPVKIPLVASGIMGMLVMCGSGYWMVHEKIIWGFEHITNDDLNKDGFIGPPPTQTYFGLPAGPNFTKYGNYPISPELIIDWCTAAVLGQSLSHDIWAKKFATPGQGDGREKYIEFRRWLCAQGYAKEVGGNVGLRILWNNQQALGFIAGFANSNPEDGTPLLESESGGARNTGSHRQLHTRIQTQDEEDDEK